MGAGLALELVFYPENISFLSVRDGDLRVVYGFGGGERGVDPVGGGISSSGGMN